MFLRAPTRHSTTVARSTISHRGHCAELSGERFAAEASSDVAHSRSLMKSSLEGALIEIWRQSLVENADAVRFVTQGTRVSGWYEDATR